MQPERGGHLTEPPVDLVSPELVAVLSRFRPLIVGDDAMRANAVSVSDTATLGALIEALDPVDDELNTVLDRLGGPSRPSAAEQDLLHDLGVLWELVQEAQLELDRRAELRSRWQRWEATPYPSYHSRPQSADVDELVLIDGDASAILREFFETGGLAQRGAMLTPALSSLDRIVPMLSGDARSYFAEALGLLREVGRQAADVADPSS